MARRLRPSEIPDPSGRPRRPRNQIPNPRPNPNPHLAQNPLPPNPPRAAQGQAWRLNPDGTFWLTTMALFGGVVLVIMVINHFRNQDTFQDHTSQSDYTLQLYETERAQRERKEYLPAGRHSQQALLAEQEKEQRRQKATAEDQARKETEAREAEKARIEKQWQEYKKAISERVKNQLAMEAKEKETAEKVRIEQERQEREWSKTLALAKIENKKRLAEKLARRDAELAKMREARKAIELAKMRAERRQRDTEKLAMRKAAVRVAGRQEASPGQKKRDRELHQSPWETLFNNLAGADSYQFDHIDRSHIFRAYEKAVNGALGISIAWNNVGKNHHGWVVSVRDGTSSRGNYCRELKHLVSIKGRAQAAFGTVCQENSRRWYVLRTY